MFYVDVVSGLKCSNRCSFKTILKTFIAEKAVSGEFSSDLRNLIVKKSSVKGKRADRDSVRARYFLTKKLLIEEFEKNEELVPIMNK